MMNLKLKKTGNKTHNIMIKTINNTKCQLVDSSDFRKHCCLLSIETAEQNIRNIRGSRPRKLSLPIIESLTTPIKRKQKKLIF